MSNNSNKAIYFFGLNGLRAIAAIAVLLVHITQGLNLFGLNPHFLGPPKGDHIVIHKIADYAVSIFFGISGFLITYLLLVEKASGNIDIRNFYIRRILRIWPLYYLYLLLSLMTNYIFDISYDKSQLFFYFFMMANIPFILRSVTPLVTHYWSLGVEEQYYLFWPNWIKKVKHIFKASLLLFIFLMSLKFLFKFLAANPFFYKLYYFLDSSRFQCMLIGGLFAILYYKEQPLFIKWTTNIFVQLFAWITFALLFSNNLKIAYVLNNEIVTFATCLIIIAQISNKNKIFNLENKIFNFLGKISYGIYVIHPILVFYLSKSIHFQKQNPINYLIVYILCISTTILLAYLSYEYYEKWFLKLKHNYSFVNSRNS